MFDEKQLQNLQVIEVDQSDKQADFKEIEKRLNKKPFYWQVPAVALSMMLLVLFLFATMPIANQDNPINLSSDAFITQVLSNDGKADPKSIYYLGVRQTINPDELNMIKASIDSFQRIDEPLIESKIATTYRINYSDGSHIVLHQYVSAQRIYFKEAKSEAYYELEGGKGFIYFKNTKPQVWQYVLFGLIFLLLFGGNMYIDKKMRVDGDPKRKQPMHSHYTQSLITFLYILITFMFFMIAISGNTLLHIGWLYTFSIIIAVINIFIEQKHDNNSWRKLRFINTMLMLPTYLFLVIQLQ